MNKKKLRNYIIAFLFLFTYLEKGICQSYETNVIPVNSDTESKLRDKNPYIDHDGFLWYTIRGSIVKEYGTTRILYPMNSPNNANYHSHAIYKTSKNVLWVGTNIGAYSFNLNTGKSYWLQFLDEKKHTPIEFTSFIENPNGSILMATRTNKLFLHTPTGEIETLEIDKSFYKNKEPYFRTIIKERLEDGSILFVQGMRCFRFDGKKFELLFDINENYGFYEDVQMMIFSPEAEQFKESFQGNYMFSGKAYYYSYLKEINRIIVEVPYKFVYTLPKRNKDIANTKFKIVSANQENITFSNLTLKDKKIIYEVTNEIKTGSRIVSMRLDNENNIITQNRDAFFIVKLLKSDFETFLNNKDRFNLETAISCRSMAELSDGTIIVFSVAQGFFKLSKNKNKFEKIDIENEHKFNERIYGFFKQNDSILYGYGYSNILYKVNLKTKKFTSLFSSIPGPVEYRTYDVEIIGDKLVTGGTYGLEIFDLKTKQFEDISQIGKYNIRNKSVGEIYFDKAKNELWLGMLENYGLYKVNLTNDSVVHYNSESKEYPLLNNNIRYIYKSKQNNIWVGTENGLHNINENNVSQTKSNIEIKNENVTGIFEKENFVWYATFNGLKRFDKNTGEIKSYYKQDGLPDSEFNYKSVFEDSNNNIYFGGINGLARFNPEKVVSPKEANKIFLAELKKFDKESNTNKSSSLNLDKLDSFQIPYSNNYLTLKFAINDLFNLDKNVYYYRLKEINNEWISLENYGTIRLNGINPSIYTLEVKGINSRGVETNTLKYKVHIEQIFYKSWWFLTIVICLGVCSLVFFSIYRIKQIKKKVNQRIQLSNLEARALRAQMDSHFIFNVLNSLQNLIIQKNEKEVNRIFSEFSKLIRYTLNISRIEYILLKKEISYLRSYVTIEKFRLNNNLDVILNVDAALEKENIKIPCMLFQPIIENAIIHGLKPKKDNRTLKISFLSKENYLIGIVEDNGVGREVSRKNKQKKHDSIGSHILEERVQILNYQKKDKILVEFIDLEEENQAKGTLVKITIPLKNYN